MKSSYEELLDLEPRVGGDMLPTSIGDHARALHVLIGEEQAKPNPDTALIGTLCNAIRFVREIVKPQSAAPGRARLDSDDARRYRALRALLEPGSDPEQRSLLMSLIGNALLAKTLDEFADQLL